jgi:hypothetical protein
MKDMFEGPGSPVSQAGFDAAVADIGIQGQVQSLWSILAVETRGFGYQTDRRPKILFERHVFHARTGGKFSAAHPDISNKEQGGYLGGPAEYGRLKRAMVLDRTAALESASWGLGQVMGFNATAIGYSSAEAMVTAFVESEDRQLEGCARFITANSALQKAVKAQNWDRVAFYYNGKKYAAKGYHKKLAAFHQTFSQPGMLPQVDIRAAQARLTYLGFNPKGIDGVHGQGTSDAIKAFQAAQKLTVTGQLDNGTAAKLKAAAGA